MRRSAFRSAVALTAAAALLYVTLVLPDQPKAVTWARLTAFPLELPLILLALLAVGDGRGGGVLRALMVAALVIIAALKSIDYAMFTALSRGFNPVADLALVEAGMRLLVGAVGPVLAALAALAALVGAALTAALLWWATGIWARAAAGRPALRGMAVAGAVVSTGVAAADVSDAPDRWALPANSPGAASTTRYGIERYELARATLADLRAFKTAAANDPFATAEGMLDLIDRDVIIVFVESYGRTSLDTPFYADLHRATLSVAEAELNALGLATASGILAAPTRGGQSWLSHATFANGLWVDGQTKYGAVLASGRQTMFHLAQKAGFHTAAVMPQITLDWPESAVMGFETVLAAADLGYEGLNFNWVTMPDQFTYHALDRLLREASSEGRHRFVQVATGSSHAPFVPVPDLVEWEAIGDGRIFNAMATSGDTPTVVWRDRDRVRAQYRLAVDYALQAVLSYAARNADHPPLLIIVGDHQAAGFIALDERPDVPIHVIGPAHLVERAARDWSLSPGLIPPADAPVVSMDQMRDRFLTTFSAASARSEG